MKRGTHRPTRRPLPTRKPFAAVFLLLLLTVFRPGYGASIFTGPLTSTSPALSPATTVNAAGITFAVQPVNTAAPSGSLFTSSGALNNINALGATPNSLFFANGAVSTTAPTGYGSLGAATFTSNVNGGIVNPSTGTLGPNPIVGSLGPMPGVGFGGSTGAAAAVASSTISGGQGAVNLFSTPTFVADTGPANPPPGASSASEVLSHAISTYQVNSTTIQRPGVGLAVSGTLGNQGSTGAFVASSLETAISLYNSSGVFQSSESTSVVIVSNGTGSRTNFVAGTGVNVPGGFFAANYVNLGGSANSFYAYGVSDLPLLTIPAGWFVTLDSTLSMVADPPMFDVFVTLDVLPDQGQFNPTLGALSTTPEPSSYLLFATGVLGALWRGRKYRNARS